MAGRNLSKFVLPPCKWMLLTNGQNIKHVLLDAPYMHKTYAFFTFEAG